jgi:hypothetical protein
MVYSSHLAHLCWLGSTSSSAAASRKTHWRVLDPKHYEINLALDITQSPLHPTQQQQSPHAEPYCITQSKLEALLQINLLSHLC